MMLRESPSSHLVKCSPVFDHPIDFYTNQAAKVQNLSVAMEKIENPDPPLSYCIVNYLMFEL